MVTQMWVNFGSGNGLLPDGSKPLPEPMFSYNKYGPVTFISEQLHNRSQIAKFMGPTWGPPGSCRPQMGPMLVPWTFMGSGIPQLWTIETTMKITYLKFQSNLRPNEFTVAAACNLMSSVMINWYFMSEILVRIGYGQVTVEYQAITWSVAQYRLVRSCQKCPKWITETLSYSCALN